MRKIFTLLLLLIPLWMQAQDDYTWDEKTKTLTIHTDIPYDNTYETKAETLIIESTYTTIIGNAFKQYTALKKVIINDGVTSIENYAFNGCSALTEITIPGSVTSIGGSAFKNCSSLESITIPEGVTSIEYYTFQSCTSLKEITIPGSVTSIGGRAFENCSSLESITIPEGVTSIEVYTFKGCSSLKEITIPGSVTSIGVRAFENCSSLESVTIPEGVTSIEVYTFKGCSSLKEITIPGSVTSIKNYAFSGCSALTSIVYEGTKEPEMYIYTFPTDNTGITVTVPENYTGDGFGEFSLSQIKGKACTLTLSTVENGSISAQVNGEAVTSAKSGDEVTLVAIPEDGYMLGEWTVSCGEEKITVDENNTFTMPFGGVTVTASFVEDPDWVEPEPEPEDPETPVIPDMPEYYNIMVEECEGVMVETSSDVVREGTSMTFTIDIAEGYTDENMTVKVKRSLFGTADIIEPNDEGIYEVKNIYTDIYITIAGVEEEEETPTGMEDVEGAKVYTKDGSIYVQTPKQEQVQIISISGAVLKNETQIGLQRYDLPRGIYIICIGEQRFKVRN